METLPANGASAPALTNIEKVLVRGDLSGLNAEERVLYNHRVCESLGLNPLTNPFQYIKLNGREVLYATRGATEQLRRVHGISLVITAREKIEDIYVVTARARSKDGREDESTGAVPLKGLAGEALANALMKAETKAKRRVTLSICGLGMLDESEIESIPNARPPEVPAQTVRAVNEHDQRVPDEEPATPVDALLKPKPQALENPWLHRLEAPGSKYVGQYPHQLGEKWIRSALGHPGKRQLLTRKDIVNFEAAIGSLEDGTSETLIPAALEQIAQLAKQEG